MMEKLERLDSWYGRLSDITEELTEMGFDVVEANAECIDVAFEEDGDDVHVVIYLGNKRFIHALGDVHVSSFDPEDEYYDEFNTGRLLFATRFLPYINKEKGMNTTDHNPYYLYD